MDGLTIRQEDESKGTLKTDSKQSLDERYWINELCLSNGYDVGKSDVSQIALLELFLSVIQNIPGLSEFCNLSTLRLVGCHIEEITNLESLRLLKELWICEGNLKRINGLGCNKNIMKLYLYDNKLTKIENLSHLTTLTTLWVNKNQIEIIENMEELRQLRYLNISDNRIKGIGASLICNNLLEEVNLSGNLISSLKDITNLSCLRDLVALDLRDPMCLPNPVTLLCNYSTYVLYHMPSLQRLDSVDVSQKLLKESTESTVLKKKIFYKMRIRTIERHCTQLASILKGQVQNLQEGAVSSLHRLTNCVKEIERELDELSSKPAKLEKVNRNADPSETDQETTTTNELDVKPDDVESKEKYRMKLTRKLRTLKDRAETWEQKFESFNISYERLYGQLKKSSKNSIQYLQMEFASGGNVRFEEGSSADVWFNSCQDLIQARFSAQEFKDLSISGLKVHRITRVQNRLQKVLFETKLQNLLDDPLVLYKDNNGRRQIDYLFLIPRLSGVMLDHNAVVENGFLSNLETNDICDPVQVTNSIRLFDKHRIKTIQQSVKNGMATDDACPFRFGQALICKVYLGKSVAVPNEKRVSSTLHPNCHSVFRTKKHLTTASCTQSKSSKKSHYMSTTSSVGITSSSDYCECTARKCTWHVFDHELVLPEYIVDFEYLTATTPSTVRLFSNILSSNSDNVTLLQQKFDDFPLQLSHEQSKDSSILNMEPVLSSRPRLTVLSEDLLLKQTQQCYLNKILYLDLHGNGLAKMKLLSALPNIKKLVLSFNELTTMADLGGSNTLEYLDVSFNQITGLDGFKLSPNVTYLDISWNSFFYTRDDVGLMRKNLPALKTLRSMHNPWMKKDNLRLRCIGRLRSLIMMDGKEVTEEETNIAVRLAACSRIAYITVLANSRTDKEPLRTLNLSSTTNVLMTQSLNKPVKLSEDDKRWLSRVTCLYLDGQHLSKISNLEKLENLKWASFNNNDITKIEGLDYCKNLIELSLSKNSISRLEGLNHLYQLQSLDVSGNNLSSLDGIDFAVQKLKFIAFDDNFVLSLNGLQHSPTLLQIYAGNNKIQEMREVFYLKSIPSLIILDLLGNPLVHESNNYRLFLIYHLQQLKALDGVPVDFTEGCLAKDCFGGKLSTDFVAEKLGHSNFIELSELDFPNCNLRTVVLPCSEMFNNLRSLNLEQNNLTSFGGIVNLIHLKVLSLNHNHIESIVTKKAGVNSPFATTKSIDASKDLFPPLMENLEVLHLGYNGISNMQFLELGRLVSLKALFLQGNEISRVDGLDGLYQLRELVLDKNKIKNFQEVSFRHQWKLVELHVEENRLRDLSHFESLSDLNRLYIGLNKIQNVAELEKLECLPKLFELSVIGNPVAKRLMHRPSLIFRQPNLLSIDGVPVTHEERSKAELHFVEQQGGLQVLQVMANTIEKAAPGIPANNRNPLKMSNFSSNVTSDRFWNPVHQGMQHPQNLIDHHDDKGNNRGGKNRKSRSHVHLSQNATRHGKGSNDYNRYQNR